MTTRSYPRAGGEQVYGVPPKGATHWGLQVHPSGEPEKSGWKRVRFRDDEGTGAVTYEWPLTTLNLDAIAARVPPGSCVRVSWWVEDEKGFTPRAYGRPFTLDGSDDDVTPVKAAPPLPPGVTRQHGGYGFDVNAYAFASLSIREKELDLRRLELEAQVKRAEADAAARVAAAKAEADARVESTRVEARAAAERDRTLFGTVQEVKDGAAKERADRWDEERKELKATIAKLEEKIAELEEELEDDEDDEDETDEADEAEKTTSAQLKQLAVENVPRIVALAEKAFIGEKVSA
jgi:hypothetical protein